MEIKPFEDRVAGHDGMLTNSEGVIMKPINKKELNFYEQCPINLRTFLPNFYGTLKQASQEQARLLSESTTVPNTNEQDETEYLCLENLLLNFKTPNLMDIKLGYILYDKEATEEKKERMIKKANSTTTSSLGLRICGYKFWNFDTSSYKKSGREDCSLLNSDTIKNVFNDFIPNKLPKHLREFILKGFITEIEDLKNELLKVEACFRAASLMMIYESDLNTLEYIYNNCDKEDLDIFAIDIRLIDFAHSHFEKGIGYDKDVIKSLENLSKIINDLY